MPTRKVIAVIAVIAVAVVLVVLSSPDAAAKKKGKKVKVVPSGFLGDYSDFKPSPEREWRDSYRY